MGTLKVCRLAYRNGFPTGRGDPVHRAWLVLVWDRTDPSGWDRRAEKGRLLILPSVCGAELSGPTERLTAARRPPRAPPGQKGATTQESQSHLLKCAGTSVD